jgi:hypothetical protein
MQKPEKAPTRNEWRIAGEGSVRGAAIYVSFCARVKSLNKRGAEFLLLLRSLTGSIYPALLQPLAAVKLVEKVEFLQ